MSFVRNDSRYLRTKLLKDSGNNIYFDAWKPLTLIQKDSDQTHMMERVDLGRFDNLAHRFFGNSNIWWAIPHSNKVEDPFTDVDWSEASSLMYYPNYVISGQEAKVVYPTNADEVRDKKLPEFEIGSIFQIPSRDHIQEVLLEAQKEGNE